MTTARGDTSLPPDRADDLFTFVKGRVFALLEAPGRAAFRYASRAMARFHMPPVPAAVGEALVERGLLAREPDMGVADVILKGGTYRYTAAFWERVGAIVRQESGPGWVVGARTPEDQEAVRVRLVAEWVSAGAPAGWARSEADAGLESLLVAGPRTAPSLV